MSYRNMRIVGLVITLGLLSVSSSFAAESERGMSPTDLAARQRIKYKAMDAASDGVVTTQERRDILAEARYVLKPEEMEGLKNVLDRFAPPEKVVRRQETLQSTPRTATHAAEFKNDSRPFLSKLIAEIPYVDGSADSIPSARTVAKHIPYVDTPKGPDMTQLKPLVSSLPRRDEMYIEQPRMFKSSDEATMKLKSQASAKTTSSKERAYVSKSKSSSAERTARLKRSSDEKEVTESGTRKMYADSSVAPEAVPTSVESSEAEKPAAKAMYEQSLNAEASGKISRR